MLTLALVIQLATLGNRGFGCLNGYPSITTEFKQRYGVFVGTVLSERYEPPDSYFVQEGTTYTVRVDELFKGRIPRTVQIFSENTNARFPMDVGTKYLLFLYRDHGRMIADNCGNSEAFSAQSKALRGVRRLWAAARKS